MFNHLFSKRNGYSDVNSLFIREQLTPELENAINNCYDDFRHRIHVENYLNIDFYYDMEAFLWRFFLNQKMSEFGDCYSHQIVLTRYVSNRNIEWFRKLDIIEVSIEYMNTQGKKYNIVSQWTNDLVYALNFDFKRLNFAYRIIDGRFVEITSEEEISAINQALDDNLDGVREHLNMAIEHCSRKPDGDYRNSIKESISAVEVVCRKKTGANTLGEALKDLEKNGVAIPQLLKVAFEKLYAYTNNKETGIRHGLMDSEGTYTPGADEAIFMIVSCSAFINYLNKK